MKTLFYRSMSCSVAKNAGVIMVAVMMCHVLPVVAQDIAKVTNYPLNAADAMHAATPKPVTDDTTAGENDDADVVTLNFVNADIDGVVKVMSEITGKNFVIDPRVKGTVNIVSANPLPRESAYEVFLSALRLQGYAAVEDHGVVSIVPETDAKLHPGKVVDPHNTGYTSGDQIQTRVFALKYESAVQLVPVLRPLISPNNSITAYQSNNTLVITDYTSNLERLDSIIESIDLPSDDDSVVIPLQYASAVDVAAAVNRLFTEAGAGTAADPTQRFTVIADVRSNSLMARTGDPSKLAQLRKFVRMLDSPTNAGGNIHVIYLKNAEAVKLAETLRSIYQNKSGDAAVTAATMPEIISPMQPQSTTPDAAVAFGNSDSHAVATTPGIIQADATTNSIIITAPDAVYNNLRAVVEKLDVRRAQVYVEALIAELTADDAAEFGVQWQDMNGFGENDATAFGGTNFGSTGQNILGISRNPGTAGRGLNLGIVNGQVSIPGIGQIANIGLLVRALETDANANILSTPTLLTLDNEEAVIVIGQNVPFITGQYALSGTATTPTPFQTVERHDVGLTLRIKPQISEGGTVRLQIYQEVSSINDKSNLAGVITNKRAVASTVLVDDGKIVVIGGLIQDAVEDGDERVPILGSIPWVGQLFRYKKRTHSKTNLMIFLRPTLVHDSEHADAYTSERYDYILGEQIKSQPEHDWALPDVKAPTLPPKTGKEVPPPLTKPLTPAEPAAKQVSLMDVDALLTADVVHH